MNSIAYLTIAFLSVTVLHLSLILFSKSNRRETISEHAAHSNLTLGFYILGHIVSSIAFYLFAKSYFVDTPQGNLLMTLTIIGCVSDIIQAFIPARGKLEIYHTIIAYIMSFAVLAITFIMSLTIPVPHPAQLLLVILTSGLIACLVLAHTLDREHFWKVQITSIFLAYAVMYTVVLS